MPVRADETAYPRSPRARISNGRIRSSSSMISTCAIAGDASRPESLRTRTAAGLSRALTVT